MQNIGKQNTTHQHHKQFLSNLENTCLYQHVPTHHPKTKQQHQTTKKKSLKKPKNNSKKQKQHQTPHQKNMTNVSSSQNGFLSFDPPLAVCSIQDFGSPSSRAPKNASRDGRSACRRPDWESSRVVLGFWVGCLAGGLMSCFMFVSFCCLLFGIWGGVNFL